MHRNQAHNCNLLSTDDIKYELHPHTIITGARIWSSQIKNEAEQCIWAMRWLSGEWAKARDLFALSSGRESARVISVNQFYSNDLIMKSTTEMKNEQ